MIEGTVRFFNDKKGFGFIKRDDGRDDIFVHVHDVVDETVEILRIGDRVSFEEGLDKRRNKPEALKVQLIEANGGQP
jgi:CspA family cold shock protein